MAIAVALWSIEVTPGEPTVITPPADVRVTNIALGDEVADEKSRTTVKLTYRAPGGGQDSDDEEEDDEEEEDEEDEGKGRIATTVLGSLTCGRVEQMTVDVILSSDEEYLFELVGKNTVYLTGNYIDQNVDQDPYSDEDSEEDDYDLRDVSSDVEIDPEELEIPSDDEGRFEEINDEDTTPKETSKKRPRESDVMDTDKPSKADKKKQKKLKGENGEAVEAPSPAKKEEKGKQEKEGKKDKKDKVEKKKAETKTVQGGVQIADHKVGSGPKAKNGDRVSVRYIGKLQNGKVFDQNKTGKPFEFRLGKGEVIKGWDIGIAGMQPGGERLLTIPAPMAYGKKSQPGIPSNSTLIFEVKLLEIKA
ncbi:hypothetical protein C8Q80DRAFT_1272384 [Daedaleopsis nitida]|nr:hypothetical protein C8Q80DRAFT_1272384 [Daedaleopsis nitida]